MREAQDEGAAIVLLMAALGVVMALGVGLSVLAWLDNRTHQLGHWR